MHTCHKKKERQASTWVEQPFGPEDDCRSELSARSSKIVEKLREAMKERPARITKMTENMPLVKKLKASAAKSMKEKELKEKKAMQLDKKRKKAANKRERKIQLKMQEALELDRMDKQALIDITKKALDEGRVSYTKKATGRGVGKLSDEAKGCMKQSNFNFYMGK